MRRVVLTLIGCALLVALTATAALASGHGRRSHSAHYGRGIVAVVGTVKSVDASTGTFTGTASVQSDDAQGSDDQGEDAGSSSSQTSDDQGEDTQGSDDQGSTAQGSDDQGSSAQGDDDQGSSTQGDDDQGSSTQGSDDQGSDDQGSDDSSSDETITTGSATPVTVDGEHADLSRLHAGEHFVALYHGTKRESLAKLVAGRPVAVIAGHSRRHHVMSRTHN